MANPPRKIASRRSTDSAGEPDDLFQGDPVPEPATPPAPAPPAPAPPAVEEWTLDDAPAAGSNPARARIGILPISPIHSSSIAPPPTFESNENILETLPESVITPAPAPTAPVQATGTPSQPEVDPFDIDEDLPAVAPLPLPAREAPATTNPEEPQPSPPDPEPVPPEPTTPPAGRERLSLIIAGCILLGLLALFGGTIYANRPAAGAGTSLSSPKLPIEGNLIHITGIETGWHPRQTGDLVSSVEVTLPSPSRQQPALLPSLTITVDAAATKTGYLRIIFLDPDRKISGDVRVLKFNGGTIEPLNTGAKPTGPGATRIYGSMGFMDRPSFISYAGGNSPRWSIELSESSDYSAGESAWNPLQTFEIRHATSE